MKYTSFNSSWGLHKHRQWSNRRIGTLHLKEAKRNDTLWTNNEWETTRCFRRYNELEIEDIVDKTGTRKEIWTKQWLSNIRIKIWLSFIKQNIVGEGGGAWYKKTCLVSEESIAYCSLWWVPWTRSVWDHLSKIGVNEGILWWLVTLSEKPLHIIPDHTWKARLILSLPLHWKVFSDIRWNTPDSYKGTFDMLFVFQTETSLDMSVTITNIWRKYGIVILWDNPPQITTEFILLPHVSEMSLK